MGEAWGCSVTDHTPACALANLRVQAVSHNLLAHFRSCLGESSVSAIFLYPWVYTQKARSLPKSVMQKFAAMIIKFHQVEFPKSWVIGSVSKCKQVGQRRESTFVFLEAHSHLLSLWEHEQEGWRAASSRLYVNVRSQRSDAEAMVVWLLIHICCDLQLFIDSFSSLWSAFSLLLLQGSSWPQVVGSP